MAWYLAPSLAVLRSEVNTRWPGRDHTSDGTIGDEDHQARESDHNPNSRESVDAWDMDKDGVDVNAVIAAFQRHPSAHYWIWQRQIADRDQGWQRRAYSGDNAHTEHVHFSIRQSQAAEQDRQAWGLLEGPDMNDLQDKRLQATDARLAAMVAMKPSHRSSWSDANPNGVEQVLLVQHLIKMDDKLTALATRVEALGAAAAQRDADLKALLEKHSSGQIDAEAVVRRMGELLSSAT